jgi:hypothetical protein
MLDNKYWRRRLLGLAEAGHSKNLIWPAASNRAEPIAYRQISLNGSGLIAVYLTVFAIEACPRKCWRRLVSIPLLANAYPVEWRSM